MLHLKAEELNRDSFKKLGDFEDLLTLSDTYSGKKTDSGFFPDAIKLDTGSCNSAISIAKVCGNVDTIKAVEYHNHTCEGILPLDGDVYIFAAPPFWFLKLEETRLFRVPKGTFVKLKAGVIHGSPISADGSPVNVLITLPERTYSNDCVFIELEEKDYMTVSK